MNMAVFGSYHTVLTFIILLQHVLKSTKALSCSAIPHYNSEQKYWIHDDCDKSHNAPVDRITREGCESINGTAVGAVPVTALETGETYKNIYCAICHGNHHRLARWQLDVKCDNSVYMNTSLQMDSLGNCRLKIKKPSEAPLQPCTGTERKRRSTIGRGNPDKDCSKTPSLGYSTLLNFGLDGQTHYLLTSDMEEFLSKSLCASDNTIFNPFRKTCIRLDCPQDQISYDGKCINQTANGEKLKLVCVDYQIDFTLYHPTLTDVNEQDFDKSLINVWVTKEGLHPANEVLPRQDLNQSLCSEGDGSFRKNFRRSNTYNPRELMLTDTENCNVSDGTTTDSTGEDNSVRQLFVSLEAYVKSEEEERHMLEMSPFVIHEKTEEIVGAGCASAVSTTVLDGNWCSGFKKEYKNDEFEVLTVTDGKVRLVGIYVFSTNKTYYQSEFQYTAVVNGQFWGNISQVAIVCDKQDDEYKAPASCTKLALGADDYTTLPDGSIHVPAFQKFSEIELPFETEKREEIKNTFAPSEYWTITNDTLPGEFNATAGNSSEPTVSVCMPESLLALLIELQLWDRVHVTASCSYLAPFGHGSSIAGLVCSGLSMLAMVAALVTYTLFKSLRTLPGVCLMHLTAAILLSQISFFVNLFLPVPGLEEDYSCFSLAALTHYFILASFFWMNVMAFTSYRAFGADLKTQLHQYKRRDLVCNSLYGWGVPAVIVTTCTAIDYCLRDERLIGYGVISTIKVSEERNTSTDMIENIQIRYRTMALCWISNSTAALIVFGVPLVYSMVVNVSFFIKTCIGMRCRKRQSNPSLRLRRNSGTGKKKERNEMVIHARLSAQYGFAWIFAIVIILIGTLKSDSTVICYTLYILNLLFNILHGCTGLFIFIAFVCNRRVLHLYRFRFQKSVRGQRSKSTTSVYRITSALPSTMSLNLDSPPVTP